MTSAIAAKLVEYVRNGGTLVLALPHLSSHVRREDARDGNYRFDVPEAAELAGFEVTGRGQFRWLTAQRLTALPYSVNRIGSGTCYCFTAWSYPGDAALLETFKSLCHRLAGELASFKLLSDGRVAGVPYCDGRRNYRIHLLNFESSAQRVRVEIEQRTVETKIGARSHLLL